MFRLGIVLLLVSMAALPLAAAPTLEYMDSGQWSFNDDCAVHGDTVATSMAYGVQLWNTANPAAPTFIGDFYTDGYRGRAVAWEGDLVASTSKLGHIYLLDVSDPTQPALIQRLSGAGADPDVVLYRDGATRWCYTAGNASYDFQIRDLSDPANPVSRGALNLSGTPNNLTVLGNTVLVCARSFGVYVIDVSLPDEPVVTDSAALTGTHLNVSADGTRAAVASSGSGFTLLDISDPGNIVTHATVIPAAGQWSGLNVREVLVSGTTLYAICENVGALVYDITNLDGPVLTGYDPRLDIDPPAPPYYVFNEGVLSGGKLYLSSWSGYTPGCVILDATASTVDYLGRTTAFDYVRDIDEDGGFAYGCTGQMGVFAHEHVSATEFIPRGQLHVVESWGVQAHGNIVYVASTTDGLVIGDFTDPDNPIRRGELDVGQARQLTVIDNVAYVAAFTQGFHTVDVSNLDLPVSLDSATRPGMEAVNVSVVGGLAATSDRGDGMNLWDVSSPASISFLANWPTPADAVDVVLDPTGNYAYLTVQNTGVQVIDVSTPGTPVLLNTFAFGSTGTCLENGYLHVSTGGAGISSYHQSVNPVAPIELASFNTTHNAYASAVGINFGEHYVYVADYSGIVVLRLAPDVPAAVSVFDLAWDGEAVAVNWELAEATDPADLRLTVSHAAAGAAESELDFAASDAEGRAFRALDDRVVLAEGGAWRYKLYGRDPGGTDWQLLRSDEIVIEGGTPLPAVALRAWPNPFNPKTTLSFELPAAGPARLSLYSATGRRVALLHEGPLPAGPVRFDWEGLDSAGRELPGGVYLARLEFSGGSRSAKLVMVR